MKKCILVPDSFKGTMTSLEVAALMKAKILEYYPDCQVRAIPVADGGEGTVDCLLHALGGEKIHLTTCGPLGERVASFYGMTGRLGIVEMAASAGFALAKGRENPLQATTYGVGELIYDAIRRGCREIILGLGGSCTNDAGAGMAAALGAKFFDTQGREFIPVGKNLGQIASIDLRAVEEIIDGIKVTALCDVDNPLWGPSGAACVFAPQKGATPEEVVLLDRELQIFAGRIATSLNIEVASLKGAGAAGGMGAGVIAFLGGQLRRGIDLVLDLVEFEKLLQDCDVVFTGEGRLDRQSLAGKVIAGVGKRARALKVPVIAIVGEMEENLTAVYDMGVTKVFETGTGRRSEADFFACCRQDLNNAMEQALQAWGKPGF